MEESHGGTGTVSAAAQDRAGNGDTVSALTALVVESICDELILAETLKGQLCWVGGLIAAAAVLRLTELRPAGV